MHSPVFRLPCIHSTCSVLPCISLPYIPHVSILLHLTRIGFSCICLLPICQSLMHLQRVTVRVVERCCAIYPCVSPLSSLLFILVSTLLSCPVLSCPLLSCPVLSSPLLSCPLLSCPLLSSPLLFLMLKGCGLSLSRFGLQCLSPVGLTVCLACASYLCVSPVRLPSGSHLCVSPVRLSSGLTCASRQCVLTYFPSPLRQAVSMRLWAQGLSQA